LRLPVGREALARSASQNQDDAYETGLTWNLHASKCAEKQGAETDVTDAVGHALGASIADAADEAVAEEGDLEGLRSRTCVKARRMGQRINPLLVTVLITAASACNPGPLTPTATRPATAAPRPTQTPTHRPTDPPTDSPQPTDTATPQPTDTAEPLVPAGCIEAQVVEVVDGDTINVRIDGQEYSVRYIGIDAPETHDPEEGVEWMGPEATQANKNLVSGRRVYLEEDVSETDYYG